MAKKKAKKTVQKKQKKASKPAVKTISKQPVQPLSDRVLVRREDVPEKKSVSGIILPDSSQKEKSKIGIVLAVGRGRVSDSGELIPMNVEIGDRVVFNSGWDNEVSMGEDDVEYFLVRETDILAITNK